MTTTRIQFMIAGAALACGLAGSAFGFEEEKETIRKNFPAAARLEVADVTGFIHISGYNGSEIQMVAEKRIEADTRDELETAKREVTLETKQTGDTLSFYVDGPFRCNCDDRFSVHDHGHRHYRVVYDFDIKVPAATILKIGTVNGGDITVNNTTGDFDAGNVNGSVELREVSGSGLIHTVNGKIVALFSRNPAGATSFKTVNGSIEASFRPSLAADVRVKTFNGSAYTDFQSTALPSQPPDVERRSGRFVFRTNRYTGLRIGSGGPELKFETLNGSIRIINRGQ